MNEVVDAVRVPALKPSGLSPGVSAAEAAELLREHSTTSESSRAPFAVHPSLLVLAMRFEAKTIAAIVGRPCLTDAWQVAAKTVPRR